jgi:hypothetical protein
MRRKAVSTSAAIPATQAIVFAAGWLLAAMIALTIAAQTI